MKKYCPRFGLWISIYVCSFLMPDTVSFISQSTQREAMDTFWHTFYHDGKISPAWCGGGGVHAHPLLLYLPSSTKLCGTLQLRGQIHSPHFYSIFLCALWFIPQYFYYCRKWARAVSHTSGTYKGKEGSDRQKMGSNTQPLRVFNGYGGPGFLAVERFLVKWFGFSLTPPPPPPKTGPAS